MAGTEETRAALIRAGERLMAQHGIEGASIRAIQAAAGQRNRSALNYYFGDRQGLVHAIGDAHRRDINRERNALLDTLTANARPTYREFAEVLVRPLARELTTASGRCYIVILAEAVSRAGSAALLAPDRAHTDSIERWASLVATRASSVHEMHLVIGQVLLMMPVLLADLARSIDTGMVMADEHARHVDLIVESLARVLRRR